MTVDLSGQRRPSTAAEVAPHKRMHLHAHAKQHTKLCLVLPSLAVSSIDIQMPKKIKLHPQRANHKSCYSSLYNSLHQVQIRTNSYQ